MMECLGLKLSEAKTKVIDARQGSFEFARKVSFKSAKMITLVEPSRKSQQRFRAEGGG